MIRDSHLLQLYQRIIQWGKMRVGINVVLGRNGRLLQLNITGTFRSTDLQDLITGPSSSGNITSSYCSIDLVSRCLNNASKWIWIQTDAIIWPSHGYYLIEQAAKVVNLSSVNKKSKHLNKDPVSGNIPGKKFAQKLGFVLSFISMSSFFHEHSLIEVITALIK